MRRTIQRLIAIAMLAVLVVGCRTQSTEFIPTEDGGMLVKTTGQQSAEFERDGMKGAVDSRKASVLRNIIEFIGLKAAGTNVRAGK